MVRNRAICSALDGDELEALNAIGRERKLTPGESLFWEGELGPRRQCHRRSAQAVLEHRGWARTDRRGGLSIRLHQQAVRRDQQP